MINIDTAKQVYEIAEVLADLSSKLYRLSESIRFESDSEIRLNNDGSFSTKDPELAVALGRELKRVKDDNPATQEEPVTIQIDGQSA